MTVSRMSPSASAKPWTTRRSCAGRSSTSTAHTPFPSLRTRCTSATGATLGKLTDVLQHGAVDVYVFQSDKGEWMAPALKAVFPAVDVQNRIIRVMREKLDEVAVYNE